MTNVNFLIDKKILIELKKILLDENKTLSGFLREKIDEKIKKNKRN